MSSAVVLVQDMIAHPSTTEWSMIVVSTYLIDDVSPQHGETQGQSLDRSPFVQPGFEQWWVLIDGRGLAPFRAAEIEAVRRSIMH